MTQLAVDNTLDNLIAAGRIPPLIAVGVASPERNGPGGVARFIAGYERRSVRFYLEVGTKEIGPLFGGDPSTLTANRHLRDVLIAKGYDLTYVERPSGHEPVAWRETFHLGLEELFGH